MGKLFWKFFLFAWISQLVAISCVVLSIWMQDRIDDVSLSSENSCLIDSAISTLQNGGMNELKKTLIKNPYPLIYVIDENKKDIFNRKVSNSLLKLVSSYVTDENVTSVQETIGPDKRKYTFFMPIMNKMGEFVFREEPIFPFASLVVTVVVSLMIAAFLAWYLSKPISYLRSGFRSVAKGNLNLRLAENIGSRRDELSDLGHDFDYMTNQLLNLMNAQRNLLHAVSHELRSPLTRIQLAVGLSRQQPQKAEMLINRIESETARLDKIIDEFMALSYLESNAFDLNKEKINFCQVLDEIVLDAQFEAAAKKQHIEYAGCSPVDIYANAEYLHKAIENIVRNAIKYTPEQGTINIHVKTDAAGITLTVVDDGPGIPEDEISTIFEPFFRGKEQDSVGYGLGLTIAKRVIELHHGTIKIYNNGAPLKGACVELYLPIENNPQQIN